MTSDQKLLKKKVKFTVLFSRHGSQDMDYNGRQTQA